MANQPYHETVAIVAALALFAPPYRACCSCYGRARQSVPGTIPMIGALSASPGIDYWGEAMIDNRTQVFDIAIKHAHTIEACVDRLSVMGADHELKLVAQRLSRLAIRAAPSAKQS